MYSGAQNIIGKNLLAKFHEDPKIHVAFTVLTRKNAPPPGSHIFQPTGIIFKLVQDIIEMNLLLTKKNAPPLESHVFQANLIIFELIQDIIETNLLTKFHEEWTINVASRMLTRTNALPLFPDDRKINVTSRVLTRKNAPPPWWPYFIGINLLTKFQEDRTINVASRVLTRFYYSHIRKNAPPHGSHVFQANVTIFNLIQDINNTNLLTIFHEDRKINVASRVLTMKNAPPPGGHVFQPTCIIFDLVQDIIGINLLSKKNASPLGSHVFQANVTTFELIQDIIETNLLTKLHEDWTIWPPELTMQMLTLNNGQPTTHDGRQTKGDHKSSP
ncbi:hypothetical protein DPMN_107975 [Dreissena polymorpha]|uniref:Uncharacterized protein n=1 Tax=Dreissena polymorpha TaxID=45954 RepID=A0A9D4QKF3_DREPO|nr:hypothetical protein DPMN_107975 [Dreissena polymorpha]